MDSRHESREQEILNELINGINIYILDNLDEIVVRDKLLDYMKVVSKYIYDYAEMPVNVDDYISKKNLLSVDLVHLPKLDEDVVLQKGEFSKTINEINSVICVNAAEDYYYRKFKDDMQRLLNKYMR